MGLEDRMQRVRAEASAAKTAQDEIDSCAEAAIRKITVVVADFVKTARKIGAPPEPAQSGVRDMEKWSGFMAPSVQPDKERFVIPESWKIDRNLRITPDGKLLQERAVVRDEKTRSTWWNGKKVKVRCTDWIEYEFAPRPTGGYDVYLGEIIPLDKTFGVSAATCTSLVAPPGTIVFVSMSSTYIFSGVFEDRLAKLLAK